jgi:leucyl aminopeptidase
MGAYLGVQQGSMFPPQFIHLHYKPENPSENVVKVGDEPVDAFTV